MFEMLKVMLRDKNGELSLDELGKLILGVALLLILVYITTVIIKGEFTSWASRIKDSFNIFK